MASRDLEWCPSLREILTLVVVMMLLLLVVVMVVQVVVQVVVLVLVVIVATAVLTRLTVLAEQTNGDMTLWILLAKDHATPVRLGP